jgi:hypothetical protein
MLFHGFAIVFPLPETSVDLADASKPKQCERYASRGVVSTHPEGGHDQQ